MSKELLREKIEAVKTEMAKATAHLDTVMSEIEVAPRAQKVAISVVVREAFERLKAAQAELADLQVLLSKEE